MEPEKKSNGAFVGIIIIIIILIVGGVYIWQAKVQKALEMKKAQEENTTLPNTEANSNNATDINELDALEQDLNSLDTNVDVDINSIN